MNDLFNKSNNTKKPLADILRPERLCDILGQESLISENGIISQMIENDNLGSLVLWGPPGCGKTTIARAIANESNYQFIPMSAVFSGVSDIKKAIDTAKRYKEMGKETILFIDEIHRFNKTQQDTLLPYIEDGTIIFIGATTENPSFHLNNALLSRSHICVLEPLNSENLIRLMNKAEGYTGKTIPLTNEAKIELAQMADGDARFLLNQIEYLINMKTPAFLTPDELKKAISKRAIMSDKAGDEHYNLISAVHKSLRASDVNAALYWVARMMVAGQDTAYIFRRLTRFAMEDIGLADPMAMVYANNAWQIYERIGSPEGDIAITELVIYLATAPKSIGNDQAQIAAWDSARKNGSLMPPKNILNAPTKMMKELGYNAGYIYDPETKSGVSGQNCWPEQMKPETYYFPREVGFEREIIKRLEYFEKCRKENK